MPGECEMAAALGALPNREQVLDRPIGRIAGQKPVHSKTEWHQRRLQAIEHQPCGRGHARAGDQRFGKRRGIGGRIDKQAHFLRLPAATACRHPLSQPARAIFPPK